jgi:hypothetical protein
MVQQVHGKCGKAWSGTRACHCSGCCETFSGIGLFDAHRNQRGEYGSCIDPSTMRDVELRDGVWSGPEMTEDAKRRAFGRRVNKTH